MTKILSLLFITTFSSALTLAAGQNPNAALSHNAPLELPLENPYRTIYGEDQRKELYEVKDNAVLKAARAVGGLILNKKVLPASDKSANISLQTKNYGKAYGLCSDVRFAEQAYAPFATGFLISDRHFATAAHAVVESSDDRFTGDESLCRDISVVFDYAYFDKSDSPAIQSSANIYRCKKVVYRKIRWLKEDMAVIELDRPVRGRTPLIWSKTEKIEIGTELIVIGHPHGIPLKISTNATVREVTDVRFASNSDTSAGNSGSPILNQNTLEVEGIHVSGEVDIIKTKSGCRRPKNCNDTECWGSWGYRPPLELRKTNY